MGGHSAVGCGAIACAAAAAGAGAVAAAAGGAAARVSSRHGSYGAGGGCDAPLGGGTSDGSMGTAALAAEAEAAAPRAEAAVADPAARAACCAAICPLLGQSVVDGTPVGSVFPASRPRLRGTGGNPVPGSMAAGDLPVAATARAAAAPDGLLVMILSVGCPGGWCEGVLETGVGGTPAATAPGGEAAPAAAGADRTAGGGAGGGGLTGPAGASPARCASADTAPAAAGCEAPAGRSGTMILLGSGAQPRTPSEVALFGASTAPMPSSAMGMLRSK